MRLVSAVEIILVCCGLGLLLTGCNRSKGYEEQRKIWRRYIETGHKQHIAGDLSKALETRQKALAMIERARSEYPNDQVIAIDLANALGYCGDSLFCLARFDESAAVFEQGHSIAREAVNRNPSTSARLTLAMLLHVRSRDMLRTGNYEESLQVIEECRQILLDLEAEKVLTPEIVEFRKEFVELSVRMAKAGKLAGDDSSAVPSLPPADQHLAWYCRVMHSLRLNDLDSALAAMDAWRQLSPTTAEEHYSLACGHGLIVNHLEQQLSSPSDEQRLLKDKHIDAALAALKAANVAGYAHMDFGRFDVDFLSLRELPEFQELVGEEDVKPKS